jgi:two-component system response regulator
MAVTKILLAEDDPDDRDLFCRFVKNRKDIEMITPAENGVELFSILGNISPEELPGMIILDYNMPKRNGLEALQMLKANERYRDIPVMLYSTYTDNRLLQKFKEEGAAAVSLKPVSSEGYNEMISTFLLSSENP